MDFHKWLSYYFQKEHPFMSRLAKNAFKSRYEIICTIRLQGIKYKVNLMKNYESSNSQRFQIFPSKSWH